jgi:hypothetical protein
MAEQDEKEKGGADAEDGASESKSTSPEGDRSAEEEPRPGEAFKQGLGLLWKAAKSTAEELKKEVDTGRVSGALSQAGHDLETAATQAAKAVESFLGRMSPPDPKSDGWPAGEGDQAKADGDKADGDKADGDKADGDKGNQPKSDQVDADTPTDGGTTEDGERRDMRIQVDDKDDGDK